MAVFIIQIQSFFSKKKINKYKVIFPLIFSFIIFNMFFEDAN